MSVTPFPKGEISETRAEQIKRLLGEAKTLTTQETNAVLIRIREVGQEAEALGAAEYVSPGIQEFLRQFAQAADVAAKGIESLKAKGF